MLRVLFPRRCAVCDGKPLGSNGRRGLVKLFCFDQHSVCGVAYVELLRERLNHREAVGCGYYS